MGLLEPLRFVGMFLTLVWVQDSAGGGSIRERSSSGATERPAAGSPEPGGRRRQEEVRVLQDLDHTFKDLFIQVVFGL